MNLSFCASLVRQHDHDRYLCTLLAPPTVRDAWFALLAFNHEIASIPEIVSEEMIGYMRFAWWRETLDAIYAGGPVRKHPVAEALAEVIKAHQLPRAPFDTMMEAREARFGQEAFTDAKEWEPYFQATSSSLLTLCAHVAGVQPGAALDTLGMAWAYIGTARGAMLVGENDNATMLTDAGVMYLEKMQGDIPAVFKPFAATVRFYAKRLGRDKKTGREAAFSLLLALCWQRLIRKI